MPILLTFEFAENHNFLKHFSQVCGKALKDPRCKLNQTVQQLGLIPFSRFFSTDADERFDRNQGLATVQGRLTRLRPEPAGVWNAARSIANLEVFEQVLAFIENDHFRLSVQSIGRQENNF